jgi:flagellar hook-basal body complex protein FliE
MAILPVGGVGAAAPATPATGPSSGAGNKGGGFGHFLADAINKLDATQLQAANSSEAIATGKSNDITKLVDAYNDLFRMQI